MNRSEVVIIAALSKGGRVIGIANKLPWHFPEDLKRFKRLTVGHTVLMGRKTFDSIVSRNGKPLPDRRNIVLSKNKTYPRFPEVDIFKSFTEAVNALRDEKKVFIIGGESLFAKGLEVADRLELTVVADEYEGDAFFPPYEHLIGREFKLNSSEQSTGCRFETYLRIESKRLAE